MPNSSAQAWVRLTIREVCLTILSLAFFIGGVWLLSIRAAGWTLFWGLILTPIGIAFTVYTLDEVARSVVVPPPFKPTRCNVCGKTTYAEEGKEDVICGRCWKEITEKVLKERAK